MRVLIACEFSGVVRRALLNETENRAASDFADEHYKLHNKTANVVVTAIQTGIGYGVSVQCPYCRETKDITDLSDW